MENSNDNKDNSNQIELLFFESVLKIYVEQNKLNLVLYEEHVNDKQLLKMFETLEQFYEVCKKKNKRFFFVIDFSLYWKHPNTYELLQKCVHFLNKHREFYEEHKISTICIVDSILVKMALNMVLKIYTPVRPLNFFNSGEEVIFDEDL